MKTPFLSTAFSENGKKMKKRFERILEIRHKRIGVVAIVGSLAAVLILSTVFAVNTNVSIIGGADGPTKIYVTEKGKDSQKTTLDEAISASVLNSAEGNYLEGETVGEGHIIMDVDDAQKKVYVLTTYGEYGFENGKMIKVSGTGVIPTVMQYADGDTGVTVTSVETPGDGSMFGEDVKKMFPRRLWNRCMGSSYDEDYKAMLAQEHAYVRDYLKKIGRSAEIGEYEGGTLLTDLGVPVEVSNALLDVKNIPGFEKYPIVVGNREYIEDGVRVLYTLNYTKGADKIVYEKTEYDTGDRLEYIVIDAKTGEVLTMSGRPEHIKDKK